MSDFSRATALFGGSFDPVHEGHLHVARELRAALPEIEQLLFVPANQSPGKPPPHASAAQRLSWLRLAVQPAGFGVWDTELTRGGDSFTVDTLEQAHRQGAARDRLFFVVGYDAFSSFSTWKNPARIRELCRLVVVNRPGQLSPQPTGHELFVAIPPHPASSSEIRDQLASGATPRWLREPVLAEIENILPLHNPYGKKK